jgi:hypothetical protein
MASTYTGLGIEKMTTGENAGDWGTKTNTNLQIIEQIAGGYTAQSIAGSAQTTTLSVSDGSTGAVLAHRIIEFTGTITGNQVVTIPLDVQTFYIIKNNTSGAYTVQFKYVSGSGSSVTWAATDKGTKLIYATADDGTNPNLVDSNIGGVGTYDLDGGELTLDADSDTSITASTDDQIDFEIAGADDFTMTANAFNVLTGSHATFADSANAKFGTGNDMLVYHDGSNSYITNATGALKLATETSGIALTIGHTTSETTVADNLTVTGDFAAGNFKFGGTDFADSILIGHSTTGSLDAASGNYGFGTGTLDALTSGDRNIGIGYNAGTAVTEGLRNVILGGYAGDSLTTGDDNTALGDYSMSANITADANTAVGKNALQVVTGASNTAIGKDAGLLVAAGDYNICVGQTAGNNITSGSGNVVIGVADVSSATGDDQFSISDGEDGSVVWMTGDSSANLTFPGALQVNGAITVGVDDTGLDVKLFGASAGAYALWDESADLLDIRGATAAGPGYLKLTTGELTVVDADKLGRIDFQAPLESSGTDAILVGASIWAEADDTFAAGVNNTDIVFATGKSEAAAEKFRFTADNEIGVAGANYGTDGQVLTSGGAGAAVAWEDIGTASGAIVGKTEGTNFTDSLLVGHSTTGTLSSASDNTGEKRR